jgi:hypothetical protein
MGLILQALGVLVGGLLLARPLARIFPPRTRIPLAGVGLTAALAAGVLFFVHAYETGDGLPGQTRTDSEASLFEAEHAADPNANNAFLQWARNAMLTSPARNRGAGAYYLEPVAILQEPELYQWSTYELLPERVTSKLGEADWIVFYGVLPTLTAKERSQFGEIAEFSRGYAVALRTDAR